MHPDPCFLQGGRCSNQEKAQPQPEGGGREEWSSGVPLQVPCFSFSFVFLFCFSLSLSLSIYIYIFVGDVLLLGGCKLLSG